ncbi:Cleavage and polyadenylation specificity factor subunit 3 [Phytophthora cinnamomi]|uniref:Cleavage and polyadenylation specificity factor subunit 3 n=1 Tax=Phytophthora cinnamomi TaxID=4785 RepID=UPI00355A6B48|nr:Cleavage and polyadenylation specificity factor subunit 3 [Phytophthora cinnamomi]
MTVVRRLQARVQRWHLLGRYYVNKWHYDGSKWAERVWYGQGSTGNGPQVASVAFMITRSMRQQLLDAGFPPSAIATLQPAAAQKILADKLTFAQFEEQQKQRQVQEVADRAKQALQQEEEQQQQQSVALVAAGETQESRHEQMPSAALVVQQEGVAEDEDLKKMQS